MSLFERARNIIVTPKTEWQAIAVQSTPDSQVIAGYVLPLAAIAALAWLVGVSLVGVSTPFTGNMRIGIAWGLVGAILHLVMAVVMVYVLAFIIDALAPSFGAQKGFSQAIKVAAYAYTPVWVMGIVQILPLLGILVLIAAIYAIYLLYLGLQAVMKGPAEKAAGYTAVVVIAGIVVSLIVGAVVGAITAMGGLGVGMGMGMGARSGRPPMTIDPQSPMGKLDQFGKKMDEANRRMEAAQKSGDPGKQMEAALGALGTALSGGKGVDPVQLDALKPFVPDRFAGLPRTELRTDRSGVKGLMVAKAEGVYGDGARRVELEVTDTGGAAGLVGLASWMGVQGEHEDSRRREVTRQENGRIVHEEMAKQGGDNSYSVVLGERFVVSARGHGVDLETLRSGVNALDLPRLAALK
jgi:uncharacterized membrane protein